MVPLIKSELFSGTSCETPEKIDHLVASPQRPGELCTNKIIIFDIIIKSIWSPPHHTEVNLLVADKNENDWIEKEMMEKVTWRILLELSDNQPRKLAVYCLRGIRKISHFRFLYFDNIYCYIYSLLYIWTLHWTYNEDLNRFHDIDFA